MAYSLFSPSTANSYANSFQQVRPVSGFADIMEDRFSQMFANVPLERYKQEMAFARDALGDKTQLKQSKMEYDYYRDRDKLADRKGKINTLMNMLRSGGGAAAAKLVAPAKRDPMSQLLGFNQVGDSLANSLGYRFAGSKKGLDSAIAGMPAEPSFDAQVESPNIATTLRATQFTTPVAESGKLQDVTATPATIDLMKQFVETLQGKS